MNIEDLLQKICTTLPSLEEEVLDLLQGKPVADLIGNKGTIIPKDSLIYLNQGVNSSVWQYEDQGDEKALKIFFEDCRSCALSYDTYSRMKDLSLEKIVQPTEIFKYAHSEHQESSWFDAYSMKYLELDQEASVLEKPLSSLVENLEMLEDDVEKLATRQIEMKDIKMENSMFHQEDSMLYLTDIDLFHYLDLPKDYILKSNYTMLFSLMRNHLHENIERCSEFNVIGKKAAIQTVNRIFAAEDVMHCPLSMKTKFLFYGADTPKQYLKRFTK